MKRLPTEKLAARCPSGFAVYVALLELSEWGAKRNFITTREAIGRRVGIKRVATISAALTALKDLKLIRYAAIRRNDKGGNPRGRSLKFSFVKGAFNATSRNGTSLVNVAFNALSEKESSFVNVAFNATSLRSKGKEPSAALQTPSKLPDDDDARCLPAHEVEAFLKTLQGR